VLELLALGHTNKQIGSALNIAAVTVMSCSSCAKSLMP
jgi:DNA-binding NarL/FixJ family response regulator